MKTAKTNKNLIKILSAIISVVFAFIVGITYCVTSLDNLKYGANPKTAQTYFANQQLHVINDTVENPILYGCNTNSFEVAIQYAVDYDFDLRLKYSLTYSNGTPADNVVLNFVNRDNIIVDGEYIFIANSVQAGNGKIPLMSNVEFADSNNESLIGKRLTISIEETDVKFHKSSSDASFYNTNHKLFNDVSSSIAAQAWLKNKQNKLSSSAKTASAVVYNYRRNKAHGVSFPGVESAYLKPVRETSNNEEIAGNVYDPSWAGGNTAFAGVGMYVISGSENIRLKVQVAGIWRITASTETFISENNVKFNYTSDWAFTDYSSNKLWEVRTFNYIIPAKTSCYIDILDSIEITCAGMVEPVDYDDYRLVANSIRLTEMSSSKTTVFTYTERIDGYIQFKEISSLNYAALTSAEIYAQDDVKVVNTTKYSSNLYDAFMGNQTFNSGVVLINNSNASKQIKINLGLVYSTSNTNVDLFKSDGSRATNFDEDVYYKKTVVDLNNRLTSTKEFSVKLDAFSSVVLVSSFSVSKDLKDDILFDDTATSKYKEYYDVWVSLTASLTSMSVEKTNLTILSTNKNGETVLSVKNNTNKTITGIQIDNLSVSSYSQEYMLTSDASAPIDWQASFWKYYKLTSGVYEQLTELEDYKSNSFYKKVTTKAEATLTYLSGFVNSSGAVSNPTISLKAGETVEFAKCGVLNVVVSGFANAVNAQTSTSLDFVNSGKSSAYLINNSSNRYYVRFTGNLSQSNAKIYSDAGYNYYIGIISAGQIVNLNMSSVGTLEMIPAQDVYNESILTGWSDNAKNKMNQYFNIEK